MHGLVGNFAMHAWLEEPEALFRCGVAWASKRLNHAGYSCKASARHAIISFCDGDGPLTLLSLARPAGRSITSGSGRPPRRRRVIAGAVCVRNLMCNAAT